MGLPNPLSRVLDRYTAKKSDTERLATGMYTKQDTVDNAFAMIRSTDPKLLAFLWLAIEEKRNILIIAENNCNTNQITDLLSLFVPSFHLVQEFSYPEKLFDSRLNFISAIDEPQINLKKQLDATKRIFPERLIIRGRANSVLKDIFPLSPFGISFVTTINGNFYNRLLVKQLLSKEFRVDRTAISYLDLVMFATLKNGINSIQALTEYRWLEQAEIKIAERELVVKNHRGARLMDGQILDIGAARNSKTVAAHAKYNLISIEAAMQELWKKEQFLKKLDFTDPINKKPDFMEYYYAIK